MTALRSFLLETSYMEMLGQGIMERYEKYMRNMWTDREIVYIITVLVCEKLRIRTVYPHKKKEEFT